MLETCGHPGTYNLSLPKIVQAQKGSQGRVRAGAASGAAGGNPLTTWFGNEACWDGNPGLNPCSPPWSGHGTASGLASGHAHPCPTAAQVPAPKEGLSSKAATVTCFFGKPTSGPSLAKSDFVQE